MPPTPESSRSSNPKKTVRSTRKAEESLGADDTISNATFTQTTESSQDRDHRHAKEAKDADHARWRETGITAFVILVLAGTLYGCGQLIANPKTSPDDKKWATVVFGSIVTGSLAWLGGSKTAK